MGQSCSRAEHVQLGQKQAVAVGVSRLTPKRGVALATAAGRIPHGIQRHDLALSAGCGWAQGRGLLRTRAVRAAGLRHGMRRALHAAPSTNVEASKRPHCARAGQARAAGAPAGLRRRRCPSVGQACRRVALARKRRARAPHQPRPQGLDRARRRLPGPTRRPRRAERQERHRKQHPRHAGASVSQTAGGSFACGRPFTLPRYRTTLQHCTSECSNRCTLNCSNLHAGNERPQPKGRGAGVSHSP